MKQFSLQKCLVSFGLMSCVGLAAFAQQAPAPAKPAAVEKKSTIKFKSDEDQVAYIIGHQIAESMKRDDLKIDKKALIQALEDGLSGKASELTPQESQDFMRKFFEKQQKIRGEKNQKEGDAFLEKNKKADKVVTLPSGLQYKVLTEGKGAKPKATDTVSVDYEGTLINGTVFDSSYKRGQPVSFPVNGVIKGWTEALQLMPEGSTWMVYIPSKLAYGEQAPSPLIGPNSTLIFKVHLNSISKPAPKPAAGATPAKPAPAAMPPAPKPAPAPAPAAK